VLCNKFEVDHLFQHLCFWGAHELGNVRRIMTNSNFSEEKQSEKKTFILRTVIITWKNASAGLCLIALKNFSD